jgi:hypothetical protein
MDDGAGKGLESTHIVDPNPDEKPKVDNDVCDDRVHPARQRPQRKAKLFGPHSQKPFVSVLFEFRAKKPLQGESVEILWTRAALNQEANGAKSALEKAKAGALGISDRDKVEKEQAIERAEKVLYAANGHYNLAKFQLPIVVYGLDASAFKCLETRPILSAKLNDLLTMPAEPLDRVEGVVKSELLESRACVFGDNGRNDSDIEDE